MQGAAVIRLTLAVLVASGVAITAVALSHSRAARADGDPARGKVLFKGYCAECHTLRAAGSTGRLGPNLDNMKPSYALVVNQIETGGTGGAGLPPTARLTFGPGIHTFAAADIRDIAAFVFLSTHG
jgi:mono/diheme cytochrome c family protein